MSKTWHFPLSNRTTNQSSSGTGTDQFGNYPINNLAREVIQNSLDAKKNKNEPVVVEFHSFVTNASSFPAINKIGQYIVGLYTQYRNSGSNDQKEKAFIDMLMTVIRQPRIQWLRISDFNTTGLWGASTPSDQNTPWFAFINGVGRNQKDDSSAGSRGLGKNAIYVNSILRTMFVSTLTKLPTRSGKIEMANIGIAKLPSLKNDDNPEHPDWTQGVGFCIEDDEESLKYNSPELSLFDLDPEFDRSVEGDGTDIYLPFFSADDNWNETILIETISSFLPAILDNELIVKITFDNTSSSFIIDKNNIGRLIAGPNKAFKECKAIYNVLSSKNTKIIPYKDREGFEMTLMLLQDNLNGQNIVYEYRCPIKMRIQKESYDSNTSYTGVLLVEGEEIRKRLRGVEDATHQKWSLYRFRDSGYSKQQIEEALYILNKFVSDECNRFGQSATEDATYFDIKGWNNEEDTYSFNFEEDKEVGLPIDEVVFNVKADTTKNTIRRRFKKKGNVIDDNGQAETDIMDIGSIGEGEEEFTHPEGHNNSTGGEIHPGNERENYDPNKGEELVIARRRIQTIDAILPAIDPENGLFDLVFKSGKTGTDVKIELLKSGCEGESESTKIISAALDGEPLVISDNKICLERIEKGVRYRIRIKVNEVANYRWEVNLDAED